MSRLTKEQAADIDYLRAGIMSDYAATGGAFAIERTRAKRIVSMLEAMIDELAQAKSDRDTLAAEVRAWRVFNDPPDTDEESAIGRHSMIELCYRFGGHKALEVLYERTKRLNAEKDTTDASGALGRAAKEPQ